MSQVRILPGAQFRRGTVQTWWATTRGHQGVGARFDINLLTRDMWLDLCEAKSKCQHLTGVPLKPARADEMSAVYLARGGQATTAIAGSTLSEAEVKPIAAKGTAHVGKLRQYPKRQVQNVLGAIYGMDEALRAGRKLPITRERLKRLNFQVLGGIPDELQGRQGSSANTTSAPVATSRRAGGTHITTSAEPPVSIELLNRS
ncbi:hypothetical protein F0Q45_22870 [Mycobacterium simiae]|uniref:Uncharacterized protein n=1 Tax=Mycobacterium simiae TaxID=1784 RepID=A0A5B1BGF5_MYCSI|nr:hypothetical protein [Mycobacterium simiae]KAA1246995.1 hypothetical protein F0Q45_22870 [Mycobacterium simiae]